MNNLTGLIDADFIKYLVAYDIEKMYKGGLKPDVQIPLKTVDALIEKRLRQITNNTHPNAKNHFFLFSGKTKDNYRAQIACVKKYKGTRVYNEKFPKEGEYRSYVETYIANNYPYWKENDLEADDLCVMGHHNGTFIYSNDKDLKMSPGIHYDLKLKMFTRTTIDEGFRILMTQTLSGDGVDNIAGVDGVGPTIGGRIVDKYKTEDEVIQAVIQVYTHKYGYKLGLDRFTEMYTLVNLKTERGEWTKEKYSGFFNKLEELKKDGENDFYI